MATFAEIVTKVANDLKISTLNDEIKAAINEAIGFYDSERFWFNGWKRDLSFSTVSGQEFYDSTDDSRIPRLVTIDGVRIIESGNAAATTGYRLTPFDSEVFSIPATSGRPVAYSFFDQQIRLYPVPSAAYTVRIVGFYTLPDLVDDAEENVWTIHAAELLRKSAKRRVEMDILKDEQGAAVTAAGEAAALSELRMRSLLMSGADRIVPPGMF